MRGLMGIDPKKARDDSYAWVRPEVVKWLQHEGLGVLIGVTGPVSLLRWCEVICSGAQLPPGSMPFKSYDKVQKLLTQVHTTPATPAALPYSRGALVRLPPHLLPRCPSCACPSRAYSRAYSHAAPHACPASARTPCFAQLMSTGRGARSAAKRTTMLSA